MTARIKNKKRVYDGFFKLDELEIESDGQAVTRLVLERGHAVAILGFDPDQDKVVLINEMRAGPLAAGDDPFYDSLPAGMIDADETALAAAVREMKEETGLTLRDAFTVHAGAYASAGGSSERIAIVYGVVDTSKAGGTHGKAEEGENIKTVVLSSGEFIKRAVDGRLKDLKSLAAAFWLANNRHRILATHRAGANKPKT